MFFFITVLYCAFRLVFSWCPWLSSSSWKSTCPKMRRSSASERNSLGWAKDSFHKFRIIFRMILAHLDLINIFWTLKLTMNSSTARILKRFGAPKCFFSTQSPSSLEFPQEQVLQKKCMLSKHTLLSIAYNWKETKKPFFEAFFSSGHFLPSFCDGGARSGSDAFGIPRTHYHCCWDPCVRNILSCCHGII